MKIDGRAIASHIYKDLTDRVEHLKERGITPTLAVVLIGDHPGSISYVKQKEKFAEQIGVKIKKQQLPETVTSDQLKQLVALYNADTIINGIIIQRPAPEHIQKEDLNEFVIPEKDVDGFHPDSDFAAPVALAVERILYDVYKELHHTGEDASLPDFYSWLTGKNIVVIGKGETAGNPIITHFHGRNAQVNVVDTSSENPSDTLNEADIIISAVGKKDVLPPDVILREKILIGVGLHDEDGKLRGDFSDTEVEPVTLFYTPTPGGVGPVNVAMLLSNVVRATEEQRGGL